MSQEWHHIGQVWVGGEICYLLLDLNDFTVEWLINGGDAVAVVKREDVAGLCALEERIYIGG